MTGFEILGGISAVIAILDGSIKIWDSARKDLKLSATFVTIGNRLPILMDTLQICYEHFEKVESSLPTDTTQGLAKTVASCKSKAEKLGVILEETLPGEEHNWYERYRRVARRLGKGSEVEELMRSISEDTQNLVNYHTVTSASPELCSKLEVIIKRMHALDSALPVNEASLQTSPVFEGTQNMSRESNMQHIYSDQSSGTVSNLADITGHPVVNTGTLPLTRGDFRWTYAHSSLQPVANYISRPCLENQIETQLAPGNGKQGSEVRTTVIWGLGGAGKSQLALQYVRTHRIHYQAIFWIEASRKATIERDYIQIYKQLCPNLYQSDAPASPEDAVTAVKDWLQRQDKRCLWVMDSVDEVEDDTSEFYIDIQHYMPEAPQLDRIITTRSSRLQESYLQEAVAVAEMSVDEAVQLFHRSARITQISNESNSVVRAIVTELGCLALAVTLAGSYVGETPRIRSNLSLYMEEYRNNRKRLLGRKTRSHTHQYYHSVLSTWEMSFTAVKNHNPIAAQLLSLLSFINFDDIFPSLFRLSKPTEVLRSSSGKGGDQPLWVRLLSSNTTEIDEYAIETGFAVLQAYSLLSWQEEQGAYTMHKLVHAWGYDRLNYPEQHACSLAVFELLSDFIADHEGNSRAETRVVPHVTTNLVTVRSASQSNLDVFEEHRDRLIRAAELFYRRDSWNDEYQARVILQEMNMLMLGREDPETLTSTNNLALVLMKQGKFAAAEEMHREIYSLVKKQFGPRHHRVLISRHNLASVLAKQGRYEAAEKLHRETLKLKEKTSGAPEFDKLETMSNLASVLHDQGKYKAAQEMYQEVLAARETTLGIEHPDTVISMRGLANVFIDQGKYETAETMHRQILGLTQSVYGLEHPSTITSINNLASVLAAQDKHDEAESMQRQTLSLRETTLGLEHPSTLGNRNDLAATLFERDKYDEADELLRQNIDLERKVLGPKHPTSLTTMHMQAVILATRGKYALAEEALREIVALREEVLGPEHPHTLSSMNDLAITLGSQRKFQAAAELHRRVFVSTKKVLGQKHHKTLTAMNDLAVKLLLLGEFDEAEDLFRQTLQLRKEVLRPDHPDTRTTARNLEFLFKRRDRTYKPDVIGDGDEPARV